MSGIDRVDRSRVPQASRVQVVKFPPFIRHRLPCGLTVVAARLPRVPLVTMELVLQGGAQHDPAGRHGLATLVAGMLDEGTARRDMNTLAASVERAGSYLTSSANWDASFVQTGGLAAHWREGLSTLAEVALEPTFPAVEFERLRRQRQAELIGRRDQPDALAEEHFTRLLFARTAYDHMLVGDLESLEAITRDDVTSFYSAHLAADDAALVAAGDLDPEAVMRVAGEIFAHWPAATRHAPPRVEPRAPEGVSIRLVDRPQAAQTELRIGHAGISRLDPDRSVLRVLNSLLGGKFTSRINLNLRERHGYTYGASSRFVERFGRGPFVVSCAVSSEHAGAATREVLGELNRLREELVSDEELDDARNYLLGVFPYALQTADDLVDKLEDLVVYGLPNDDFERHLHNMMAVTKEDILASAQRHLHPEKAYIVAVGPEAALTPQFDGIGTILPTGS
ncbi:MAG: pitrilysin family protein [Acidobacteriota bacterium]